MKRFALIHFGNEESYGLLFVAQRLKKFGEIKFFEHHDVDRIREYNPEYVFLSPMTCFYDDAKSLEKKIDAVFVYGGHHAMNCGELCGDVTVIGDGTEIVIEEIMQGRRGIIKSSYPNPRTLGLPAREEYYRDIPRLEYRYRKMMLSVLGCPFSCAYCSSSNKKTKDLFEGTNNNLVRRPMSDIMMEAIYLKGVTEEIEWVDDDVFHGDQDWMINFYKEWNRSIKIPMYVSTSSLNALKAKEELLREMSSCVNCIGMGVQAIRPKSLKILNRGWDNYDQIKAAYDRLTKYGFRVNLQAIVGLPVGNPIEDAIETILALRTIAPGSIISCYPLQIYNNTPIKEYCESLCLSVNPLAGDTNTGEAGILFNYGIRKKLKNICKLATFAVKYNWDEDFFRTMLDIEYDDKVSHKLSMLRYKECIVDRLNTKGLVIFDDIMKGMELKY